MEGELVVILTERGRAACMSPLWLLQCCLDTGIQHLNEGGVASDLARRCPEKQKQQQTGAQFTVLHTFKGRPTVHRRSDAAVAVLEPHDGASEELFEAPVQPPCSGHGCALSLIVCARLVAPRSATFPLLAGQGRN